MFVSESVNDYSIKMVSFCTLDLEKWLKIRLFRTSFLIPTHFRGSSLAYLCPKYYPKRQF